MVRVQLASTPSMVKHVCLAPQELLQKTKVQQVAASVPQELGKKMVLALPVCRANLARRGVPVTEAALRASLAILLNAQERKTAPVAHKAVTRANQNLQVVGSALET